MKGLTDTETLQRTAELWLISLRRMMNFPRPAHMVEWWEMRSRYPDTEARNIRAYGVQATVQLSNIIRLARHSFLSDWGEEIELCSIVMIEITISLCLRKLVLVMSPICWANSFILPLEYWLKLTLIFILLLRTYWQSFPLQKMLALKKRLSSDKIQ